MQQPISAPLSYKDCRNRGINNAAPHHRHCHHSSQTPKCSSKPLMCSWKHQSVLHIIEKARRRNIYERNWFYRVPRQRYSPSSDTLKGERGTLETLVDEIQSLITPLETMVAVFSRCPPTHCQALCGETTIHG